MNKDSKIFIAGHRGLVGSAIVRRLKKKGYSNLLTKTSKSLDLRRQKETERFFEKERPEYVFLAAARVGGILANNTYRAQFIYDNIMIAANAIDAASRSGVKKLLNLGSSCIYPKFAPQPMKEDYLLTDTLEPTNEPYAIAKISAIKLCRYYNEQYGANFISVMPTNLYGPNDNFNLETSHVLPALIRKFHLAKLLRAKRYEDIRKDFQKYGNRETVIGNSELVLKEDAPEADIVKILEYFGIRFTDHASRITAVQLWGTGSAFREFLFVDDLADACIFLMERYDYREIGEFVNIGTGKDITIKDLAGMIMQIVGFDGTLEFDRSKPDGTPRKLLDTERIRKLGWEPETTLEDGIRKTYEWYVKSS
ncbi:MAG: GDP-L-fucose synthase [Thermodesulfovibrionales bacterium]|nr:GDP-L-fucose synthase [Thermodesulfovibrionales bacterium]